MDKTLNQHFLKEFKATCENSTESENLQSEKSFALVMLSALQLSIIVLKLIDNSKAKDKGNHAL